MDGGKTVRLEPPLGSLDFVKGTFPTKFGVLKVSHTKDVNGKVISEVKSPKGLKITK